MLWNSAIALFRSEARDIEPDGFKVTCEIRRGNLEVAVRRGQYEYGFTLTPVAWRRAQEAFATDSNVVTMLSTAVTLIKHCEGNVEKRPSVADLIRRRRNREPSVEEVNRAEKAMWSLPAFDKKAFVIHDRHAKRMHELVAEAMKKLTDDMFFKAIRAPGPIFAVDPTAFQPVMHVGLEQPLKPKRFHGMIVHDGREVARPDPRTGT